MAAQGGKEDYYKILGVDRKADKATIKKVYKKLAMKNHPDVNKDPGAKDTFIKINEAYAVLSDEQKRRQYDLGYACAVVAAVPVVIVIMLSQTANARLAHTSSERPEYTRTQTHNHCLSHMRTHTFNTP